MVFNILAESLEKAVPMMWSRTQTLSVLFCHLSPPCGNCNFKYKSLQSCVQSKKEGSRKLFLSGKKKFFFPGRTISGSLPADLSFCLLRDFNFRHREMGHTDHSSFVAAWVGAYLPWPQGLSAHPSNKLRALVSQAEDVGELAKCEQWLPCPWGSHQDF